MYPRSRRRRLVETYAVSLSQISPARVCCMRKVSVRHLPSTSPSVSFMTDSVAADAPNKPVYSILAHALENSFAVRLTLFRVNLAKIKGLAG